jgi:5-methylcytosine-specific restriction endonuclease McrA
LSLAQKNGAWLKDAVRRRVYEASDKRCAICKERVMYGGRNYSPYDLIKSGHIDHIVPRARGGTNDESNLRVLCCSCNAAKGAR